jgi:hypothetical protein
VQLYKHTRNLILKGLFISMLLYISNITNSKGKKAASCIKKIKEN